MTSNSLDLKVEPQLRKQRSPLGDAFRLLLRNRAAVVSGVAIIGLILIAIFANQVAPFTYDEVNFKETDSPLFKIPC